MEEVCVSIDPEEMISSNGVHISMDAEEKISSDEEGFSSVSFRNGRMEIPTIRIFERTLTTLRNLIAFEQCFPDTNNEVTFFADLMDALIDTPRDVKVLQGAGILKIGLSNPKEVTQLFNRLCRHVYYDNSESYLREVFNRMIKWVSPKICKK
ncbi:putative UPF0481 protein [Acorus calamus]|uniref:UPF0481 protein n=1 Tax=Acorus calamus TaxID=4465 RepID=A0AAV9C0R8_ACOCL|nr:putative UPF0481 protein [Acorus calamus]